MEHFDAAKLKKVETKEKSILNQDASIIKAAAFDQAKLNKVDAVDKSVLPTDEGLFGRMINLYLSEFIQTSNAKKQSSILRLLTKTRSKKRKLSRR